MPEFDGENDEVWVSNYREVEKNGPAERARYTLISVARFAPARAWCRED